MTTNAERVALFTAVYLTEYRKAQLAGDRLNLAFPASFVAKRFARGEFLDFDAVVQSTAAAFGLASKRATILAFLQGA